MRQNKGERGQAVILVLVAASLFLLGAIGLAIDGSHLYAQRQMAQVAADAAAQAAMMSIFDSTNQNDPTRPTDFTATLGDSWDCPNVLKTPCAYAYSNGFGGVASDTVTVDFPDPTGFPGLGALSSIDPINLVRVTVWRTVDTTLLRFLGPSTTRVKALAMAAVLDRQSPTPILILHPTKPKAFELDGNVGISICGGPSRSVQVNSRSGTAYAPGKPDSVDLHKAGPNGPADCSQEKMAGADFGTFGGPAKTDGNAVGSVDLGNDGRYRQPSSPITDPYIRVPAPAKPSTVGTTTGLAEGFDAAAPTPHCPVGVKKPCILYTPGLYASGIEVRNEIAYFAPGIYYMDSGKGFTSGANGEMYMCPDVYCNPFYPDDPQTGRGMLVYNGGGGLFDVGSNGNVDLVGSLRGGTYKGILFFEDRTAPCNNSEPGCNKTHNLGGGGCLSLTGTIYLTNTKATMLADPKHYQEVRYHGNPCSNTYVRGDIVVDSLHLVGTSVLRMELNRDFVVWIRQVALVH